MRRGFHIFEVSDVVRDAPRMLSSAWPPVVMCHRVIGGNRLLTKHPAGSTCKDCRGLGGLTSRPRRDVRGRRGCGIAPSLLRRCALLIAVYRVVACPDLV